jgi:hypothetical protein
MQSLPNPSPGDEHRVLQPPAGPNPPPLTHPDCSNLEDFLAPDDQSSLPLNPRSALRPDGKTSDLAWTKLFSIFTSGVLLITLLASNPFKKASLPTYFMFLSSLLYTLTLTRKNFSLKDFLLKSQTSYPLISLTFLTATTLTINCMINITLLTLNSLSTTQNLKTQKFPNTSIPDLLTRGLFMTQLWLIITFSKNFKNQTQKIYSGITKIVGFLVMIVAFCIELNYNKLISINPEFFRINSLLLNTEIQASITILVVMAIVFSTYLLCFGGYAAGGSVYRTLYISVVSLLIT